MPAQDLQKWKRVESKVSSYLLSDRTDGVCYCLYFLVVASLSALSVGTSSNLRDKILNRRCLEEIFLQYLFCYQNLSPVLHKTTHFDFET